MWSLDQISRIIICIFLIVAFLSERSVIGNIALLSIFAMFIVQLLNGKKLYWSRYFTYEVLFLVYCLIQLLFKIPLFIVEARERFFTLILCFAFEFALYNLFRYAKDYRKITKSMVTAITIAVASGILINIRSLLLFGERINNTAGFSIGEIKIGAINSAGIAWYAGIGISILVIDLALYNNKVYYYMLFFILASAIILSGTRKALVFIPLGLLPLVFIKTKGKNMLSKTLKYVIAIAILSAIGIFLILKVPALYNLMGYRIESLFVYRTTGMVGESSLGTRLKLGEIAVNAFKQKPITGWGLDNFKNVYYYGKYYSHNNYLEMAVNGGIIGLILYFCKYVYLFRCIIVKYKKADGYLKIECLFLLLTMASFAILEIWQVTYFSRKSLLIYTFLLYVIEKNDKDKTETSYDLQ